MKTRAIRITKRKNLQDAFSGEGARLFGGRWNSPGLPMIYTSSSLSLAALEILVHLDDSATVTRLYCAIPVEFDDKLIKSVSRTDLPEDWSHASPNADTQMLGDRWAREGSSVVLRVPSVVIQHEYNYILNPSHKEFSKIKIGKPFNFEFDPRLMK